MLQCLLILLALNAWTSEGECPDPSLSIDHVSPVTGIKKTTCGYFKDGILVKHGPEVEFANDGSIRKTIYFNQGKEGEKPVVATKVAATTNLPGAEEAESFQVLQQLLRILSFNHSGINDGEFKVAKCDPNSKTWVRAAITKTPVKKSYTFNEHCDVNGNFTANFQNEFDVAFTLRNLKSFNHTKMKVRMKLNKGKSGIRYRFEVSEGLVSSKSKAIHFKVEYEVDIDPLTGSTSYSSQEGKITLTKDGDRTLNITRPLLFSR